jgi:hypothetical protein
MITRMMRIMFEAAAHDHNTRRVGWCLSSAGRPSAPVMLPWPPAALTVIRLPGGNGLACGCPPGARTGNQPGRYRYFFSNRAGACSHEADCVREPWVKPITYYTWKGVKICVQQASGLTALRPQARL